MATICQTLTILWFSWPPWGYVGCYGNHKLLIATVTIVIFWFHGTIRCLSCYRNYKLLVAVATIETPVAQSMRYFGFHGNNEDIWVAKVKVNSCFL